MATPGSKNDRFIRAGEQAFARIDKIVRSPRSLSTNELIKNSELFTLTYGSMVVQLMRDFKDIEKVNEQLERMYVSCAALALHRRQDFLPGISLV